MSQAAGGRLRIAGTALEIGRLGFGCARLFGGAELRHSARLIEAALAEGIRHFDTAPAYGQSEDVLGSVLAGVPGVTVTTKVGIPRPPEATTSSSVLYRRAVRPLLARLPVVKSALLRAAAKRSTPEEQVRSPVHRRALSRDEILGSLEESLRRLRRQKVEVFLLHEPDQLLIDDTVVDVLSSLQREGTIGAFGLALDRLAPETGTVGSVLQSRHHPRADGARTPVSDLEGVTRIVHGVMRHDAQGAASPLRASARVRQLLERERAVGVIFSASAPFQIRDVCRACAGL